MLLGLGGIINKLVLVASEQHGRRHGLKSHWRHKCFIVFLHFILLQVLI